MDGSAYRAAERQLFEDAGVEPSEHWVRLSTVGTVARVLEVGEGAPALFLHGGPIAAGTWAYMAAAMTGVRCLLLERPGTGLSEPPSEIPTPATLPRYVEQLTSDVLDAFELDRAALVGSSFGGYSALRSAATFPDRVERVVVAGYPAFVPGWKAPAFFSLLRTPGLGRLLVRAPVTASSVRFSLRQLGHRRSLASGAIPDPMLEWTAAWQRHTDTMRNDAAMIVSCGSWRRGFDAQLDLRPDELSRVQAPCLVIVGTDDPVGGEDVAHRLATLLPRATVDVWQGAGHLPWLDDPQRAARATVAFLTGDETRGLPLVDAGYDS